MITNLVILYEREGKEREKEGEERERCIHDTERERDVFITDTVMLNGSEYLNSYRMW